MSHKARKSKQRRAQVSSARAKTKRQIEKKLAGLHNGHAGSESRGGTAAAPNGAAPAPVTNGVTTIPHDRQ